MFRGVIHLNTSFAHAFGRGGYTVRHLSSLYPLPQFALFASLIGSSDPKRYGLKRASDTPQQ
jgi:hypothetical protein